MSDPQGFYNDGFDGIEPAEGQLQDQLPEQWALWVIEEVEFRTSKEKQTPSLHYRVRADERMALTPKRGFFDDIWLTEKTQATLDRFTRAIGLGFYDKRFGEKSGASDPRPLVTGEMEVKQHGEILASAMKGRKFISRCTIEKGDRDKGYSDRNRFNGFQFYKADAENLEAILGGNFDPKRVKEDERPGAGGRKTRFLAVKGAAAGRPAPAASGGVIE